ncbi:MAG: hypothetical protein AB1498_10085 [bacterium]
MAKKKLLADDYLATQLANLTPAPTISSSIIRGPLVKHLVLKEHLEEEKKAVEVTTIDLNPIKKEIGTLAVKFMGKKGRLIEEKIQKAGSPREIMQSLKDIEKFASIFLKTKTAEQMLEEMHWTANQFIQP